MTGKRGKAGRTDGDRDGEGEMDGWTAGLREEGRQGKKPNRKLAKERARVRSEERMMW